MDITITQKIELILIKEDKNILDNQSRMVCKMYNLLIEKIKEEYKNGDKFKYTHRFNLRNEVPKIKQEHPYFYAVYCAPLKNVAFRACDAYNRFLKLKGTGFPKFHSFRKSWFSLLYDEANAGIKIKSKNIRISLGSVLDEGGKKQRLHINAKLTERVRKNNKIRNYRIIKEYNRYYIVITMDVEKIIKEPKVNIENTLAIDFNHKNFFVGADNIGNTFEISNLSMMRYFNDQIAKVQQKLSRCKNEKVVEESGVVHYEYSKRYERLGKVIQELYYKRNIQVTQALYIIANNLVDKYDNIFVGNYTPSINTATEKGMRKKMLNESIIGNFREILKHVCARKGKLLNVVDEKGTTMTCFNCGYKEKKDPSIRKFICPNCGRIINRDVNSAINIAEKDLNLFSPNYLDLDVSKPGYAAYYDWHSQSLKSIRN